MNTIDFTINQMRRIVRNNSRTCIGDTEYDVQDIKKAPAKFAMIWVVTPTSTALLNLSSYRKDFFKYESKRYRYANGDDGLSFYLERLNDYTNAQAFLITDNGLSYISKDKAWSLAKEYVKAAVHDWLAEGGSLPTNLHIPIELSGIQPQQLRAIIRNEAKYTGQQLIDVLRGFKRWLRIADSHVIKIRYSSRDNEFYFTEYIHGEPKLSGAIVFHGWAETGYQKNNSFQVDPSFGWHAHS